jgi:hypothetical protein
MWIGGLVLAAIVLSSAAWSLQDDVAYARIATGYAAKETCSCRHVSGRPLDSCLAEFPAEARANINVTETPGRVRASVLFGAISAEAQFEDAYGCTILN